MDLTESFVDVVPLLVRDRYDMRETRQAAAIIRATDSAVFSDIVEVLADFTLTTPDLVTAGGNKSAIAKRLDEAFRARGWREGRMDTQIRAVLRLEPWLTGGERGRTELVQEVHNEGYKVDNVKGRIALDVEWNAKDGNLDRDLSAYRAVYEAGFIDAAVLITRTIGDLQLLATRLAGTDRLGGTTTTNLTKLQPRMTRGDAGGCPLRAVAITARVWEPQEGEPDLRGEAAQVSPDEDLRGV